MTKDEALKLALEALERSVATCFDQRSHDEVMGRPEHFINKAITAIKKALAQPEQEPVAWADHGVVNWIADKQFKHASLLYTTPPQRTWVGLTDEEANKLWQSTVLSLELMKLTEAKLKDKNTQKTTGENNLSSD